MRFVNQLILRLHSPRSSRLRFLAFAVVGLLAHRAAAECPADRLCLLEERFEVFLTWASPAAAGYGRPVQLTDAAGYFWFFSSDNAEIVVKVLDACHPHGYRWVFAAGLTDVETQLTVLDRETGFIRVYQNTQGHPFASIQDTAAFPCDPETTPTLVSFASIPPSGEPLSESTYLEVDEFSNYGFTVAGGIGPAGCFDVEVLPAILIPNSVNPFQWLHILTTAQPDDLARCNVNDLVFDFHADMQEVTLLYLGATTWYRVRAFDGLGRQIADIRAPSAFAAGPFAATLRATDERFIRRVIFGNDGYIFSGALVGVTALYLTPR